jgi:hypothetical protein
MLQWKKLDERTELLAAVFGISIVILIGLAVVFFSPSDGLGAVYNESGFWPIPEFWTAFFNATLAVSTVALWWVTRTAANAAKLSADSAKGSADFLLIAERAFIATDRFEALPYIPPGTQVVEKWIFNIVWANQGKTAATGFRQGFNSEVRLDSLPADFDYPEGVEPADAPASLVLPSGTKTGTAAMLSIDDCVAVYEGKKKVFFWGWCDYDDILPDTPRHRTEFCNELVATNDPRNPLATLTFMFKDVGPHNGADASCLRSPKANHKKAK